MSIFIAGMFSTENRNSYGQGVEAKNVGRFAKAAKENSRLSRSLSWTLSPSDSTRLVFIRSIDKKNN